MWASYRTGMLGSTILLRRRGLVTVLPPGHGLPPGGPRSVYVWPMGATTVDASAHLVYGLGQAGLIAIGPPARCWR